MRRLLSIFGTAVVLSVPACEPGSRPRLCHGSCKDRRSAGRAELLDQRRDANQTEPDGTSPLHWAVHQDRLDIVQALISAGANVNARNRYGTTRQCSPPPPGMHLLWQPCSRRGGCSRGRAGNGSVLSTAARTGNPEAITLRCARGCELFGAHNSGQTPLMWAAAEGHPEAVKALLAGGANPGAQARDKKTALFYAVRRGDINSVSALLAGERMSMRERSPRNFPIA